MNILLIEDNQSNADIFLQMLRLHGYTQVVHKLSGTDGLSEARSQAYDVILIDFDLPDVHGAQIGLALATLMQKQRMKVASLIALTAQSDKASQANAERLGFDAFTGKPCLDSDLIDIIRQVTPSV